MRPIENTLPKLQYVKNLQCEKSLDQSKRRSSKNLDEPRKDLRVLEIGTIKMTFTLERGHLLYGFS
ncbi:MAG: hypothetical protein M9899_09490 [Bdellovibrionaceae bacterium]|nr:hypothetical protein [Pseudobdellovibrionaceae bacterium]